MNRGDESGHDRETVFVMMPAGRSSSAIHGGARLAAVFLVSCALLLPGAANAYFLDERETVEILGRAFSQAAFRTTDSFGFTFPRVPAGNLVQHRNLVELELAHELDRLFPRRPRWLHGLGYRILYKGVYEGVYDYGPDEFSELVEVNPPSPFGPPAPAETRTVNRTRTNRQILGTRNELWNAYVEGNLGPLFLRVGRQHLSWGETDGFRLLDRIEPLDGRFGFPLVEELDDRRIPLRMVRGTLRLPWRRDWITGLLVDGYFVPGVWEDQEAPLAPRGTPFAAPTPPSFFGRVVTKPPHQMESSRGGARLLATLFGNTTVSLAHYVTFDDFPGTRVRVLGVDFVDGTPVPDLALEFDFYQQQVTGASFTRFIPPPLDVVIRAETAMFWDERVFEPVRAGFGPSLPRLIEEAVASRRAGGPGTAAGAFSRRDIFRWVIGLDRIVWIRPVNPYNTFNVSAQLFHTRILGHDDSIHNGLLDPASGEFVSRRQDEFVGTFLVRTLFWRGFLQPQVFAAYDPRGVVSIVPSLTTLVGTHVRVTFKYAFIDGNFVNLGFFRDRDEVLLGFEVSL